MTKEDLNSITELYEKTLELKDLSGKHQKELIKFDYSSRNDSEESVCLSIKDSDDSYRIEFTKSVDLKCVTVRVGKLNELLRSEFDHLVKNRDKSVEEFNNLTIK